MDAKQLTLSQLFRDDVRYEMPESQREYVWDLKGRWEPLWNDVRATAEAYVRGDAVTHFLGPLVLQRDPDPKYLAPQVYSKIVIDGQQRLTTLQLLLNATKVVTETRYKPTADALKPFVSNYRSSWPNDQQDYEYKVWSKASENDRKAFVYAMGEKYESGELSSHYASESANSPIVDAHRFFVRRIDGWFRDMPSRQVQSFSQALQQTLMSLMTVIVIDLDESDDARLIYETLNSRGTSLLQSDLVKNRIMQPDIVGPLPWPFDDRWWNGIPETELQRRNRADIFLHHWVTMRSRTYVHSMEVFDKYKAYEDLVSTPGYTRRHILNDITEMSSIYQEFENDETGDMGYYQLINLSSPDLVPLVVWLKETTKNGNTNQWRKGWLALTSFIARRRVCGLDTTGQTFREMLQQILRFAQTDRISVPDPGDRVVAQLKNFVDIGTSAWPDDVMLKESFETKDVYNDPGRVVTRDVLKMLEIGKRLQANRERDTNLKMDTPDAVDSIEHIMPRAWREHWRTSLEESERDAERRDALLHTIGNLTLVTADLNRRLGNNEWKDKQRMISEDALSSAFLMNQEMRINQTGKWDVEEIVERSRQFFDVARFIWPGPNAAIWRPA